MPCRKKRSETRKNAIFFRCAFSLLLRSVINTYREDERANNNTGCASLNALKSERNKFAGKMIESDGGRHEEEMQFSDTCAGHAAYVLVYVFRNHIGMRKREINFKKKKM